jgi:hypothetical protein
MLARRHGNHKEVKILNRLPDMTRRGVLKAGGAALATMIIARTAHADEMLSPSDPTAQALGYVEDASTVDVGKWPKKAGPDGDKQHCANCMLYTDKGDGVGDCSIFPGKLVKGAGWCNGWTARQGT